MKKLRSYHLHDRLGSHDLLLRSGLLFYPHNLSASSGFPQGTESLASQLVLCSSSSSSDYTYKSVIISMFIQSKYYSFVITFNQFITSFYWNHTNITYNLCGQAAGEGSRAPVLIWLKTSWLVYVGYGSFPNVIISHKSTPNALKCANYKKIYL